MMEKIKLFNLALTKEDLDIIVTGLGELPLKVSEATKQKLVLQYQAQLTEAKGEEDSRENTKEQA